MNMFMQLSRQRIRAHWWRVGVGPCRSENGIINCQSSVHMFVHYMYAGDCSSLLTDCRSGFSCFRLCSKTSSLSEIQLDSLDVVSVTLSSLPTSLQRTTQTWSFNYLRESVTVVCVPCDVAWHFFHAIYVWLKFVSLIQTHSFLSLVV
jgi:hypothetical protein